MTSTLVSLALSLSPSAFATAWQSPNYAVREDASRRAVTLGYRCPLVTAPLFRHRDPEVRTRAHRAFESACFVRCPEDADDVPVYSLLPEVIRRRYPNRLGRWLAGRVDMHLWGVFALSSNTDPRDVTLGFLDGLVSWGFPARWAQAWVDEAAGLERAFFSVGRSGVILRPDPPNAPAPSPTTTA